MADEPQTRALVRAAAIRLADAVPGVVGAYLHGSLVLDDFRPGRSDIDLLVLVECALTTAEEATMTAAIHDLARATGHAVDLHAVLAAVAATPPPESPLELYVRFEPDRLIERRAGVASEPELLVELATVRARSIPLVGPAADEVIGAIPTSWLLDVGDRQLAVWQELTDDDAHAELMVLTTCRVWRLAVDGQFCSKTEAGRWALARDPALAAVTAALERRAGNDVAVVEPAELARLLRIVRSEIAPPR